MEGFKKLIALLATITMLLLALTSGLISATSPQDGEEAEGNQACIVGAPAGEEDIEGGVPATDPGDSGEADKEETASAGNHKGDKAPEPLEAEDPATPDEEAGLSGDLDGTAGTPGNGVQKEDLPAEEVPGAISLDSTAGTNICEPPTTGAENSPTHYANWQSGNAGSECTQAGCGAAYAYKVDAAAPNGVYAHAGNTISISGSNGYTFDWTSVYPVACVIVVAGGEANVFYYGEAYGDTRLFAPLNTNTPDPCDTFQISHVTFCFNAPACDDPGSICGFKFLDADCDGRWDYCECGLKGVTIELYDVAGKLVASTTTDKYGKFCFEDLEPGDYEVKEVVPCGYYPTTCNPVTVTLESGEEERVKFGNARCGSICGFKFLDADCDGRWDYGECGLECVTIELYDASGALVASTTTDKYGKFCFEDLKPGNYTVKEVVPDGYYPTTCNPVSVELKCGGEKQVKFGNARYGSICGFKFLDADCDGRWDRGEVMLSGVTIELWCGGEKTATAVTGENGEFCFEDLKPGNYTVKEVVPCGYYPTTDNPVCVKVKCGEEERVKFGNARYGSICGFKFLDADCDGIMDQGEEGIADVRIKLLSLCGYREAWTDEFGHYCFEGLKPGLYMIWLDESTVPEGHYHTTCTWDLVLLCCGSDRRVDFGNAAYLSISGSKLDGCDESPVAGVLIELWSGGGKIGEDVTDENGEYSFTGLKPGTYTVLEALTEEQLAEWYIVSPEGGIYEDLELGCGQPVEGLDFVNARYLSISGSKLDGNESPVAGVLIELWSGGEKIGEDVTDEDGEYSFTGLKPGTYTVLEALTEEQLAEWYIVSPEGGIYEDLELVCGQPFEGLDFVNDRYGSLSGFKYEDLDADGVLDPGEPGFEGVTVRLLTQDDPPSEVATTTTDADGKFAFTLLEAGIYDVEEVLDPGVFTKTSTIISDVAVVAGEETVLEEEYFLNYRLASLSGFKYNDVNANGIFDEGVDTLWDGSDIPITVLLIMGDDLIDTDVIDGADGMYEFDGLEPGDYVIEEIIPGDSDVTTLADTTIEVTVESGEELVVEQVFLNFELAALPEIITPPVEPGVVAPQTQGQLPATGWNVLPLLMAAAALVLLGLMALVLGVLKTCRN